MKNPLRQTQFLMSETDQARLPGAEAEVAFVGRSNVGKSSLICALCDNKSLARTSKTPGRTRGIIVFEVQKGRWLVDLPGYGFATGPYRETDYWPKMIENYISQRPNLKQLFLLCDAERGVGPHDLSALRWLKEQKISCMIVGTKTDRIGGSKQLTYRSKMAGSLGLAPDDIHWTSTKKSSGLAPLLKDTVTALNLQGK